MSVNNEICIHVVSGTSELELYFTVYCGTIHNRGRVYGFGRGYKGDDLASRAIGWLKDQHDFFKIHCDSINAIYLAKNQVYHVRTKHTDVRFYFVCENLDEDDIELKKINTKHNPVNMLTKVVTGRLSSTTAWTYSVSFKWVETFLGHIDELHAAWSLGQGYIGSLHAIGHLLSWNWRFDVFDSDLKIFTEVENFRGVDKKWEFLISFEWYGDEDQEMHFRMLEKVVESSQTALLKAWECLRKL